MKLGIMQPYFFPYLGYFDLIHRTDRWVVFDIPQYIRHGWVNRNRVLHPKSSWQYIVVPLKKHTRETAISDIELANPTECKQRIVNQLAHYRKYARYFEPTMDLIERCFACETTHLSQLNVRCLELTCRHLGIAFDYMLSSELELPLDMIKAPGDWALEISKSLGATEYWNPPGGADLFDVAKYLDDGIMLKIQSFAPMIYDTRRYALEPNLSIVDVLMWCRPEEVREFLDHSRQRPAVSAVPQTQD
jgi:hypothetical protein